jgi:glycosyltransferase involved in cell wall biosynthesis
VHRVATVVTISEFCRQDLIDSYGLSPSNVHVVPLAVEPYEPLSQDRVARAAFVLAEYGIKRPFILYLGNLHPRKNVARTIRSFIEARRVDRRLRDHQLVIAGGRWWGTGEEQAAAAAPPNSVIFLGRVDDDTRRLLLDRADALAYISRFEGFGLPPLEAMAASTPVLAGDAAAIPEVTGGAALLVDPDDDEAVTAGLRRILTDEDLRAELVARGRQRAAHYDVESTGAAAKAALEAVINRGVMVRES